MPLATQVVAKALAWLHPSDARWLRTKALQTKPLICSTVSFVGMPKREQIARGTGACSARASLYLLALLALAALTLPGLASAAPGDLSFAQCIDDNDNGGEAACPGVDGLFFAYDVATSPDGTSVYVVSDQDHAIVHFSRNTTTGALTFVQCFDDATQGSEAACPGVAGLDNAQAVVVAPDGKSVYVAGLDDRSVVRFDRNTSSGALAFAQCIDDNDNGGEATCPGVDGLSGVSGLAISPDGKSLYSVGEALVRFDRDTSTGALAFGQCIDDNDADPEAACPGVDGGGGERVAVSPDGKSVYISGTDEAVVGFTRDATTGAVAFAQCIDDNDTGGEAACPGVDGLAGFLRGLDVSPDGSSVYVASSGDDAVVGFSRDPATGALTFQQCVDDNDTGGEAACPGVDGLEDARSLAVAPDGSALYLVSFTDSALVRFNRASSGALTFAQCLDDDDFSFEAACPAVPALSLATSVAASADGKSVYVTADDAISRFDVETTGGPPPPAPSPEPQPVPGGEAKADRSLTIDANKGKVEKGKKVTISGQIDAPSNESGCEAGQSVEIQAKGQTLASVKTSANGQFTLTRKMKRTLVFQAQVSESAICVGAASNEEKVRVKRR
jgi:DNA-binding beta-propeller fold protein YncE